MTQRKGITESGPRLKAMNDALERDRLRLTDAGAAGAFAVRKLRF